MDRRLFTLIEILIIGGLIAAVLYFGGAFDHPPKLTPAPVTTARVVVVESTVGPPPTGTPNAIFTSIQPNIPTPTHPPLTRPSGLIAFESIRDGNHEIYTMNADGSGQTNLTRQSAEDYLLGWSPDGTKLAFFSTRTGWLELYLMDPNRSNVRQLTDTRTSNTAYSWPISWTRDGRFILAARSTPWTLADFDRPTTLDLIHVDGSPTTILFESALAGIWNPQLSPDGDFLVAMMSGSDSYGAYSGRIQQDNAVTMNIASRLCSTFVLGPGPGRMTCFDSRALLTLALDGSDKQGLVLDFRGWPNGMAWSPDESFLLVAAMSYPNSAGPPDPALVLLAADGTEQ